MDKCLSRIFLFLITVVTVTALSQRCFANVCPVKNVSGVQCVILNALSQLQSGQPPGCFDDPAKADLNCDGKVNVSDVTIAIQQAINSPLDSSLDANGNSIVDTCESQVTTTCEDDEWVTGKNIYDPTSVGSASLLCDGDTFQEEPDKCINDDILREFSCNQTGDYFETPPQLISCNKIGMICEDGACVCGEGQCPKCHILSVANGNFDICMIGSDYTVSCLNVASQDVPQEIENLDNVISLAFGMFHHCALLEDKTVRCWGHNTFGQLGNGTKESMINGNYSPVLALDDSVDPSGEWTKTLDDGTKVLSGVEQISGGAHHTCALLSGGKVACWGQFTADPINASYYENFGVEFSSIEDQVTPMLIDGFEGVVSLGEGGPRNLHHCALMSDDTVKCWGMNFHCQLGNGEKQGDVVITPTAVIGLNGVAMLAVGHRHNCALMNDNTLKCWGTNMFGELGTGEKNWCKSEPITVPNLTNVADVAVGGYFSCALLEGGDLKCWGMNDSGTIGNGLYAPYYELKPVLSPTPVVGLKDKSILKLLPSHSRMCVLLGDAVGQDVELRCWGLDFSKIDEDGERFTFPVPVKCEP